MTGWADFFGPYIISPILHFSIGTFFTYGYGKAACAAGLFPVHWIYGEKLPLSTFSSRNRSAMQTAFCPAEGVITLTAHPHPQKSAQTFTFQHRRIHALPSRDIHLRLGFIQKLRNRCYRGYWGFIELPGYIPIENRHAGFYIRYQPDKRKIKCKHGKNDPRHKAEQHLQVLP